VIENVGGEHGSWAFQKVMGLMYVFEYHVPTDCANEYLHIDEDTTLKEY
jgi:hypothetical protein